MSFSEIIKTNLTKKKKETYSIEGYLDKCKEDKSFYASPAERMLKAIGPAKTMDTSKDPRLARIFSNRTIRTYEAFKDFFGMEEVIEKIVGYLTASAQGLEERKQILYLLGPVGGGKSSLAEKLKSLMEQEPIYVLSYMDELSPVFESPFGLIGSLGALEQVASDYNIPLHIIKNSIPSPWLLKRLAECNYDISKFSVVKCYPNKLTQLGITKTEPGDDNNADISHLVGKVDLRKLEDFSQNDPDAYSFSGALNRGNQGLVEFVEIWKAPIKTLHPLLTATQEGNYLGTENISAIPFTGIILAHSNESEWEKFKNNKSNEAFIDRISVIKVPYCLRVNEEIQIYKKFLQNSQLQDHPCAPQTLDMLAKFTVLSRLKEPGNSKLSLKMRVYNGENLKDSESRAKSYQEYTDDAGVDEGMTGISTRFAFKALNKTFNYDPTEVAADPVHLMNVLTESVRQEQYPEETERKLMGLVREELASEYVDWLGKEIQRAYIEEYNGYGQNVFARYISMADAWIQENDFRDGDTGNMLDKDRVNTELEKIEKLANIANPKDFRHEVVNFCLRFKARNNGELPNWTAYEKMREVIEKKMFSAIDEILPVISFGTKKDKKTEKEHDGFVQRMKDMGYTERQIKRLVEYYTRAKNTR